MTQPVEDVYVDGVAVSKSAVRSYSKQRLRVRVADADEVRNNDWSGRFGGLYVASLSADFDLDTSDTTSPDDGETVIVDDFGNRWIAVEGVTNREFVNVDNYGAVGDGVADDTGAFEDAFTAAGSAGGTVYLGRGKIYLIDNDLTVPENVVLQGSFVNIGVPGLANADTAGLFTLGGLRLNSSNTITISGGAGIDGVLLIRKGLSGPQDDASAFAGTALTLDGDDALVRNSMILGFAKGIFSDEPQRARIFNNAFDCVDCIDIVDSADVARIHGNHSWPYVTVAAASPVTTFGTGHYLYRNGTFIKVSGLNDWTEIHDNFDFSHHTGVHVTDSDAVSIKNNGFDGISNAGPEFVVTGRTAIRVDGTATKTKIVGNTMAAFQNGVVVDLTNDTDSASAEGNECFYFTGTAIAFVNGGGLAVGNKVIGLNNAAGHGVRSFSGNTGKIVVVGNYLDKVAGGVRAGDTGLEYGVNVFGDVGAKYVFDSAAYDLGLRLNDTNATHGLLIKPGSNLSADRALTLTTGDADRTLDISAANVTITASGAALLDDADAAAQRATLSVREKLTAGRTYYVRADGSDSNTGLTDNAGGAFLTIQKAVDVAYGTLDLSGFNVTLQVRTGTFTGAISITSEQVGAGSITILGDAGTPSNVVISTTSNDAIAASNGAKLFVSGVKLQTTTSGSCLHATDDAQITVNGSIEFGASAAQHLFAERMGRITISANYTINGNAVTHIVAQDMGMVRTAGLTITLTGTPAFSSAFANVLRSGALITHANTYSGSATGTRYSATSLGNIFVSGGGATYLPGNAGGSTGSGGQYN